MDNEFAKLEAELRRLTPRPVSRTLVGTMLVALNTPEAEPDHPLNRACLVLRWPAAVAVVLLALTAIRPPNEVVPVIDSSTPAQPVQTGRRLLDAEVGEVMVLDDGTPVRPRLDRYVDSFVWADPAKNLSVRYEVPRSEVRVVPLVAY